MVERGEDAVELGAGGLAGEFPDEDAEDEGEGVETRGEDFDGQAVAAAGEAEGVGGVFEGAEAVLRLEVRDRADETAGRLEDAGDLADAEVEVAAVLEALV